MNLAVVWILKGICALFIFSHEGLDVKSEACQRFFRDGLTISFTKILTDEAVSGWKFEIHVRNCQSYSCHNCFRHYNRSLNCLPCEPMRWFDLYWTQTTWHSTNVIYSLCWAIDCPPQRCIINNTHRLVELCVVKLSQDWFPLLELLAMATNPHCKFHIYNGTRPSESVPAGPQLADDELFACPPDVRSPKVSSTFTFSFLHQLQQTKLKYCTNIMMKVITFSSFLLSSSLFILFCLSLCPGLVGGPYK